MSHGHDYSDTEHCEFGHTFVDEDGPEYPREAGGKEIYTLEDLEDATDDTFLKPIMGDQWKKMKVKGSQGDGFGAILEAIDTWDTDEDWEVSMVGEELFVSPQSELHGSYMQQRQQAEQRVKETMRSLSEQIKQKHMLEHDIRKLRSRSEAMEDQDDAVLKGDFVELVDSAGGGQGAAPGSLDFLRNNNIYPTIVSDFNEMESVEDLEEGGPLDDLPENEKAILKKKFKMYEKWKDLYGSEVQRKLRELKGELRSTERSIEETKSWLEPYIKDMVTINDMTAGDTDQTKGMTPQYISRGYSSMERHMTYIAYQPVKPQDGNLVEAEDEDHATHFKVIYLHGVLVNIGNPSEPRQVGSETGVIMWHPAIVCRHVFERIFKKKVEEAENKVETLMEEYTGEFSPTDTDLKAARNAEDLAIRDLRKKVGEKLTEMGELKENQQVSLEFSAKIRRIEDGFESVESIAEDYSKEHLEALEEVLDTSFSENEEDDWEEPTEFQKKMKRFIGSTDDFDINAQAQYNDYAYNLIMDYYIDLKKGLGLYTMK